MSSAFKVRILQHGWHAGRTDLCSHGRIHLEIGGQVITSGDQEYGVSESALALLRTLRSGHSSAQPVAERLIPHGCGMMLLQGCGLGIDWSVRHDGDIVVLGDVVRFDGAGSTQVVPFPGLEARLNRSEYVREVVHFALEARRLFEAEPKESTREDIPGDFAAFWKEYDEILVSADASTSV